MKISSARIEDPARKGYANSPSLIIVMDEMPQPTSEVEYASVDQGVFAWRHYGPFVKFLFYSYADKDGRGGALGGGEFPDIGLCGAWSSRAGAFNVAVQPEKPLVDVTISHGRSLIAGYALELDRAQREVKRHVPDWHLAPDPQAALRGDLKWAPVETIPGCLWYGRFGFPEAGDKVCDKTAYHPFRGRQLGLCDDHKIEHDSQASAQRAAREHQMAARRTARR